MRVLHIIDRLWGGGAENSLVEFVTYTSASDELTHGVVCLVGDPESRRIGRGLGCEVWFGKDSSHWQFSDVGMIRSAARSFQPDVIAATLVRSTVALAAARLRCPVVVSLTSSSFSVDTAATRRARSGLRVTHAIHGWTLRRRSTLVHAVSDSVRQTVTQEFRLRDSDVLVAHRGRQDPTIRPQPSRRQLRSTFGLPDDVPILCVVAREHPVKNHALLLRALPSVLEERPDLRVLLVGARGSASSDLDELVDRLKISRNVIRLGHRDDVNDLLALSDVFVLPSRSEGLPGSVLEAMAHSLPVVASRVAGIVDVLGDDYGGLFESENERDLSALLKALLTNEVQRSLLASKSRARFEQLFSMELCVSSMMQIFEEARRRAPSGT